MIINLNEDFSTNLNLIKNHFINKRKAFSIKYNIEKRKTILDLERILFKEGLLKLGIWLNEKRITNYTRLARKELTFNLYFHMKHFDPYGKKDGCGCIYCRLYKEYMNYKRLYRDIKRKYLKYQEDFITDQKVMTSYELSLYETQQKINECRSVLKQLSKTLKLPKYE
jgi:hypothetical protein